jgi:hypothetical protein
VFESLKTNEEWLKLILTGEMADFKAIELGIFAEVFS